MRDAGEQAAARIVNVSSGAGSLARVADTAFPSRHIFGPGYSASKTAMNAMTLAMAIKLESTNIEGNACSPGFIIGQSPLIALGKLVPIAHQGPGEALEIRVNAEMPLSTFQNPLLRSAFQRAGADNAFQAA